MSALSSLHTADAETLRELVSKNSSGDLLVACSSSLGGGEYAWISRKGSKTQEGCGTVDELAKNDIDDLSHCTKLFHGDRLPFVQLLDRLAEQKRTGWHRSTFAGDCRQYSAAGLHDEQAWCEASCERDGSPSKHTAYVVHVLGSQNYFAYFNFRWDSTDSYSCKICHDLKTLASVYVPRMYGERDVERWVFQRTEDFETFVSVARDYRRAFTLMDYPFEAFQAGTDQQLSTQKHQSTMAHQSVSNAAGSGLRALLQSALVRLGMNSTETWTSRDQVMVNRLVKVLSGKPSGAIDLTKSPYALPKLKALLLKCLKLNNLPADAPTRIEAIELYLSLARFYPGWDEVSCEGLFRWDNPRTISMEALSRCSTDEKKAQNKLDTTRQLFMAELASHGIEANSDY